MYIYTKYSAPQASVSKSVVTAAPATANTATKIFASATVRLYKINPATNGYELHDNGNQLGCVLMGAGFQFQIIIYNGQVEFNIQRL